MDIEEVARSHPEKILTFSVDPATGIMPHHGRRVAQALGLHDDLAKQTQDLVSKLYAAFVAKDMKPARDQSAGRHQDRAASASTPRSPLTPTRSIVIPTSWRCATSPRRTRGDRGVEHDLNYVTLDGTIGCMVNGAGLAMATMDIIKLYGEAPANFLDVGGSAAKEKVAAAFKIITADPKVKGILVNIFGGIMKCDVIAAGVVDAVKEVGLRVPLVVRLKKHQCRARQGDRRQVDLDVVSADDLDDAAKKVVKR